MAHKENASAESALSQMRQGNLYLLSYEDEEYCDRNHETNCAESENDLGCSVEGHSSCAALGLNDADALKSCYHRLVYDHYDRAIHKRLSEVEGQEQGGKHFHNHRRRDGKPEVKRGYENVK